MKKIPPDNWNLSDECEHYPIIIEWWAIESFFKTIENNNKWSLKAVFTEWLENKKNIESKFNFILYDIENNKYYTQYLKEDFKLKIKKNKLDIEFNKNNLKGSYPEFFMNFFDNKNNIKISMKYESDSNPHWIAQNITNGYLPTGIGYYRYGIIPKNILTGNIDFNKNKYSIKGTGYFEHVWGNFIYDNPLSTLSSLKKTMPIYLKLANWWLTNQKLRIPNKISLATENNPIGYDWAWAILDNGWTIFYGNILFWLMNGPVMGTLILTKDGINYKEYGNVKFQYNKIQHSKNYDFYFPTEFELKTKDNDEKIHLKFIIKNDVNEYISIFPRGKYWLGLVICEGTGIVEGKYFKNNKEIELKGQAKIEPQRQVSIIGHNSLSIDIIKPPKGVGMKLDLDSNLIKKRIKANLQIFPNPKLKLKINKKNKD